jgi:hypothetical protein
MIVIKRRNEVGIMGEDMGGTAKERRRDGAIRRRIRAREELPLFP